jgi:hypothetical protein
VLHRATPAPTIRPAFPLGTDRTEVATTSSCEIAACRHSGLNPGSEEMTRYPESIPAVGGSVDASAISFQEFGLELACLMSICIAPNIRSLHPRCDEP